MLALRDFQRVYSDGLDAMTARLLDGRMIAASIIGDARSRLAASSARLGVALEFGVLVGEDRAADVYARSIERSCRRVGLGAQINYLAVNARTDDALIAVRRWNAAPTMCGVLVATPLPSNVDLAVVVQSIDPEKDVDGANPTNFGRIALGLPGFAPCTAEAIVELALQSGVSLQGARCVVVGRSNVVGKPAALLMLRHHATVTVCHSRTRDLAAILHDAEFVIAAAGRPGLVRGSMLTSGCVIIDAGTNPTETGLVGDVDAAEATNVAAVLTPVPGGVGPVTNAILMRHAAEASERLGE